MHGRGRSRHGALVWGWGLALALLVWIWGFFALPWWVAVFLWWWPSIVLGGMVSLLCVGMASGSLRRTFTRALVYLLRQFRGLTSMTLHRRTMSADEGR